MQPPFRFYVVTICVLGTASAMADDAGKASEQSIVVNPDNSVTFSFNAPHDRDVEIDGNFFIRWYDSKEGPKEDTKDMEEERDGFYTYTSKKLPSDLYWYRYLIDEEPYIDPDTKGNVRDIGKYFRYFIIPGGAGDYYVDNTDSPGSLEYVWYPSNLNGMKQRRMAVYLPNGYHNDNVMAYPVLYLLHGSGGDETAWAQCGRLAQIMDNMIAAGKCEPMIVVMPNGNVEIAAAPGEDPENPNVEPSGTNVASMYGAFENSFMDEIVAYTDHNYRTIADKNHRAIAGLSLGGLHTLYTAVNNPEAFDYVALFSAQTINTQNNKGIAGLQKIGADWQRLKDDLPFIGGGKLDRKVSSITGIKTEEFPEIYDNFDSKLATFYEGDPALFYIAVGTDDFTKKLNDDLRKKLKKKKYPFTYNESGGGHTWTNWRRYLVDLLPRLFKHSNQN